MIVLKITLLLLAFIVLNIKKVASFDCNCTPTTTELEKFHNHVLKRRTRGVVFPKKANLLLTLAFTKAILDGRPRGLSYSMEFDLYNYLPDTLEGWQPTILVNKIKQEKAAEEYQRLKDAVAVLTPQTSTTDKSNYEINTYPDVYMDAPDEYSTPDFEDNSFYKFPFHEAEVQNNWNSFQSKWDNNPLYFTRNTENPHIQKLSELNSLTKQFHKKPFLKKSYRRNLNTQNNLSYAENFSSYGPPEISYSTKTKKLPEWHRDQSYRERRHIFDQLETVGNVFNFNMKACIQRAMCEITTYLKPYGESLIEDILRIILTIPSSSSAYRDDYIRSYVNINCERHFAVSCPFRVLDFLTNNFRSSMSERSS